MRLRPTVWALLVWFALGPAQAGNLVVFGDGRTMAVDGFRLDGDRVRLEFGGGGEIAVPVASLARIELAGPSPGPRSGP